MFNGNFKNNSYQELLVTLQLEKIQVIYYNVLCECILWLVCVCYCCKK